jgi:hypothetical protein
MKEAKQVESYRMNKDNWAAICIALLIYFILTS